MNGYIKQEIIENLKEIYLRLGIIKLLYKYYIWKDTRNTRSVNDEYDKYWSSFWENNDIFRKDLNFTYNDKIITPPITPFDFRMKVIIKILSQKIKECRPKNVLEIGSGAGINLLMLAPLFPDVKFVGLELTNSGVNISKKFIKSPPPAFKNAYKMGKIKNVKIYKGDIIDNKYLHIFKNQKFEFVFTAAVLEQLNNYYDTAIKHIFSLTKKYFFFYEEWLEANSSIEHYKILVENDYFRKSWNSLNCFPDIVILERSIPAYQPSWLKYGIVFGRKK